MYWEWYQVEGKHDNIVFYVIQDYYVKTNDNLAKFEYKYFSTIFKPSENGPSIVRRFWNPDKSSNKIVYILLTNVI